MKTYHVKINFNQARFGYTLKAKDERSAEKKGMELFRKEFPSIEECPIHTVKAFSQL